MLKVKGCHACIYIHVHIYMKLQRGAYKDVIYKLEGLEINSSADQLAQYLPQSRQMLLPRSYCMYMYMYYTYCM